MNRTLLSLNSYHYRRGGSDVVYLDHAALFEECGWTARYFSMSHPKNLPCADERYFINLLDAEFSETVGAKLRTAWRTIWNRDAVAKIDLMLKDVTVDIAHVHCIYHHLTPAVLPRLKERGIPVILTAHDLKLACPSYKMMTQGNICERCKTQNYLNVIAQKCVKNSTAASAVVALEAWVHKVKKSYDSVDYIVCPSRFYLEKLAEWGIDRSRLVHIANYTKPLNRSHISSYEGPIVYFGRLSEEKGLVTLIKAAAKAQVAVDIVGEGPIETELKQLVRALNAPVRILGPRRGSALWDIIGSARAVVLPSEWYENGPMSVLEAFQLERPVIGADIGGIPEMIEDVSGSAGWTFPSGKVDALADILTQVDNTDPSELASIGVLGRDRAIKRYGKETYLKEMSKLYDQAIAKN